MVRLLKRHGKAKVMLELHLWNLGGARSISSRPVCRYVISHVRIFFKSPLASAGWHIHSSTTPRVRILSKKKEKENKAKRKKREE